VGAGVAFAAHYLGLYGYLVTDLHIGNIFTDFHHLGGNLMSLYHRITCVGVFAVIDMDVRAAYPDAFHSDLYLVVTHGRHGHVSVLDDPGACHNRLLHFLLLLSYKFDGKIIAYYSKI
jgi:hypothetical protein